ncbi:ARP2/3 complex, 20kDa subunit (P20-Arc) [Carpediemonas membranifera]|uniref:Actin-related protein 2/3 complex subunit 4 n=1 Tax=Carpediemonas membranifera TaxID=201153 RepID=A0A8J6DZR0_9EUKA|nr:ARP2/3 complex, 20kDa subunit (P20-Arc) [Carpediemonas membranifera]|eukprot:KAG9391088.1 ARP2/3 complex, 20kDa subunit (P20-Arc) [Carpediemonas membranifera]
MNKQAFIQTVRETLDAALCIENFPSQIVERHNKPEVETRMNPELILNPVTICRTIHEKVFIEPSVNSVRISIKLKFLDEIDRILVDKFCSWLMKRAEMFGILRRVPVEGYSISLLIENKHVEAKARAKVVNFVVQFLEEIDKEISEMKLDVNSRARVVATQFHQSLLA